MPDNDLPKVAFYSYDPSCLVHGGFQIQMEQTMSALRALGCDIRHLEWWNPDQRYDIIHIFGRPLGTLIPYARRKGVNVVFSDLLTEQGSRSATRLLCQEWGGRLIRGILPDQISRLAGWSAYREADAVIALTHWEKSLMCRLYGVAPEKVHVIPNGVDDAILTERSDPFSRVIMQDAPLLCVATITPRKRVLEVAQAATESGVPVQFVGAPYSEKDPYYLDFLNVVENSRGKLQYLGSIQDRVRLASIYRSSKGFVLASNMESQSLAALEAAACGLPLLLTDLPWAREVFGDGASYIRAGCSSSELGVQLRSFYDIASPCPKGAIAPSSWKSVGNDLLRLYQRVVRETR